MLIIRNIIARLHGPALKAALAQFPVVVLTGARQVGKTTLARWLLPQASYTSLDHPADAAQARLAPEQFLRERLPNSTSPTPACCASSWGSGNPST